MPEENGLLGNPMVDFGLCAGVRDRNDNIIRTSHTYRDGKKTPGWQSWNMPHVQGTL